MNYVLEVVGKRPTTLNQERKVNRWQARATDTKWWRTEFCEAAVEGELPFMGRVHISVYPLHKNGRSPQDCGACFPAAKAAIDGLIDAGIVDNDTPDIVVQIDFHAPQITGEDGLRLVVRSA